MVNSWSPASLAEALTIRREHPKAVPLAGGTDWMVNRDEDAELLFLSGVRELRGVQDTDAETVIGAAESYAALLEEPLVPEVLRRAVRGIASPAIRNMGTVGGNICNASPAGDTLPVLYALDASVALASLSADGKPAFRNVPITDFIRGVRRIDLRPGELLAEIRIPKAEFGKVYYQKVGARRADAISKLSFAGLAACAGGTVTAFRAAFGAVGPTVVRRRELEETVIGRRWDDVRHDHAELAERYLQYVKPIDDQRSTAAYRRKVCENLLEDFLSSGF